MSRSPILARRFDRQVRRRTVSAFGKDDFGGQWMACIYVGCGYNHDVTVVGVQLEAKVTG